MRGGVLQAGQTRNAGPQNGPDKGVGIEGKASGGKSGFENV
jgi:hypothetical protein